MNIFSQFLVFIAFPQIATDGKYEKVCLRQLIHLASANATDLSESETGKKEQGRKEASK